MRFAQYYLGCLSHATTWSATPRPDGPSSSTRARRRPVRGRCRGPRPRDREGPRDALPRRLPVRPPRAGQRTGAAIGYGRPRRADFPIETYADGDPITLGDVALESGDAGPHPGVDQHRWSASRATRRAVRRPDRRHAVHRRRRPPRPARLGGVTAEELAAALPLAPRATCSPCPTRRRSSPPTAPARPAARTSPPRPRPPSASSAAPTTPCPDDRGRLRRGRHPGPVRRAALLRLRRRPQPQRPPDSTPARPPLTLDGPSPTSGGRRRARRPRPSPSPPATSGRGQHPRRWPLRRVRRGGDAPRGVDRAGDWEPGKEVEAAVRLARIGFDGVLGAS